MRVFRPINVISGLAIVSIGLLLLLQTFGNDGLTVDGYASMAYPVALLYIFIALGFLIVILPEKATKTSTAQQSSVFSLRICLIGLVILLYSIGLTFIGFITASYLASIACALVMGWKRIPFLLGINFVIVIGIWLMAKYLLKMPLPEGILV